MIYPEWWAENVAKRRRRTKFAEPCERLAYSVLSGATPGRRIVPMGVRPTGTTAVLWESLDCGPGATSTVSVISVGVGAVSVAAVPTPRIKPNKPTTMLPIVPAAMRREVWGDTALSTADLSEAPVDVEATRFGAVRTGAAV